MLEHHADAQVAGGVGVGHGDRFAFPQHFAFVGMEYAVDDLDKRTLARPVLAQQRVDFARRDRQVHRIVRQNAGEPFADLAEFQAGRGVAGRRARSARHMRLPCCIVPAAETASRKSAARR